MHWYSYGIGHYRASYFSTFYAQNNLWATWHKSLYNMEIPVKEKNMESCEVTIFHGIFVCRFKCAFCNVACMRMFNMMIVHISYLLGKFDWFSLYFLVCYILFSDFFKIMIAHVSYSLEQLDYFSWYFPVCYTLFHEFSITLFNIPVHLCTEWSASHQLIYWLV